MSLTTTNYHCQPLYPILSCQVFNFALDILTEMVYARGKNYRYRLCDYTPSPRTIKNKWKKMKKSLDIHPPICYIHNVVGGLVLPSRLWLFDKGGA